jgi:nitroreductase
MTNFFDNLLAKRRSVRVYDENATFDDAVVRRGLERATLSANSSNMQTWEFYWIKSEEKHATITKACLGQSAAKTSQQMVVFVVRKDKWKARAAWNLERIKKSLDGKELTKRDKRGLQYYSKLIPLFYGNDFFGIHTLVRKAMIFYIGLRKPIMRVSTAADQRIIYHKSCALAAQTFMLSLASENYDTCPMEGFDEKMVRKILNLPSAAEITMIVACGIGKPEGIYEDRARVPMEEVIFEV